MLDKIKIVHLTSRIYEIGIYIILFKKNNK